MNPHPSAVGNRDPLFILGVPLGLLLAALCALVFVPASHPFSAPIGVYAWIILPASALAFGFSLTLLRTLRRLGQQAHESHQKLLTGFTQIATALPHHLALLGGLLMTALVGTLVMAFLVLIFELKASWRVSNTPALVAYATGALLWLLGASQLWKTWRTMAQELATPANWAMGRTVNRTQAPQLWQLVDEVVQRTQVGAPDNLIIGMDAGFFVTQAPLYLNDSTLPVTGRSLYLSVPYLTYLTRAEAMVLIGRELAHFSSQDTEYSLQFSALFAALQQQYAAWYDPEGKTTQRPIPARIAHKLLGCVLDAFDPAIQHWRGERELRADQRGAAADTPDTAALALLRLSALAPVIEDVLADYHTSGATHTQDGSLLQRIIENVRHADLDPEAHLTDALPHPRDTPPPTVQRIQALGVTVTPALIAAASQREPGGLLQELALQ